MAAMVPDLVQRRDRHLGRMPSRMPSEGRTEKEDHLEVIYLCCGASNLLSVSLSLSVSGYGLFSNLKKYKRHETTSRGNNPSPRFLLKLISRIYIREGGGAFALHRAHI